MLCWRRERTLLLALALVSIGIVSCKRPDSGATVRAEPPPQTFAVRGILAGNTLHVFYVR